MIRAKVPFFSTIVEYAKKIKKADLKHLSSPKSTKISSPKILGKPLHVGPLVKNSPKIHEGLNPRLLKAEVAPSTSTSKPGDSKAGLEDLKEGKTQTEASKREGGKVPKTQGTPWIDTSHLNELVMSPNLNTEVIRMPNCSQGTLPQSQPQSAAGGSGTKEQRVVSPSVIFQDTARVASGAALVYCNCGRLCEKDNTKCLVCLQNQKSIELSGYLYTKAKNGSMKRRWFVLVNKELYSELLLVINKTVGYHNKGDAESRWMHSLTGVFIKEELEELFDKKTVLYPFSLHFLSAKKTLFALKKDERANWVRFLKETIGYATLSDYYEMRVNSR